MFDRKINESLILKPVYFFDYIQRQEDKEDDLHLDDYLKEL